MTHPLRQVGLQGVVPGLPFGVAAHTAARPQGLGRPFEAAAQAGRPHLPQPPAAVSLATGAPDAVNLHPSRTLLRGGRF